MIEGAKIEQYLLEKSRLVYQVNSGGREGGRRKGGRKGGREGGREEGGREGEDGRVGGERERHTDYLLINS